MITITKPTMDSRDIDGDRVSVTEELDTCPRGTSAALSDGSLWQALVTEGHAPLWSQYSGPGCCSRVLTSSALAQRSIRLDGES